MHLHHEMHFENKKNESFQVTFTWYKYIIKETIENFRVENNICFHETVLIGLPVLSLRFGGSSSSIEYTIRKKELNS